MDAALLAREIPSLGLGVRIRPVRQVDALLVHVGQISTVSNPMR